MSSMSNILKLLLFCSSVLKLHAAFSLTVYIHGHVADEGQKVLCPHVCVAGAVMQITNPVGHLCCLKTQKPNIKFSLCTDKNWL